MNERIKELEAQCWEHDQSWTGFGQLVFNREKFAQMIVQECAKVVDSDDESYPYDSLGHKLKTHFGVNE